jgi:hypothetical protein
VADAAVLLVRDARICVRTAIGESVVLLCVVFDRCVDFVSNPRRFDRVATSTRVCFSRVCSIVVVTSTHRSHSCLAMEYVPGGDLRIILDDFGTRSLFSVLSAVQHRALVGCLDDEHARFYFCEMVMCVHTLVRRLSSLDCTDTVHLSTLFDAIVLFASSRSTSWATYIAI